MPAWLVALIPSLKNALKSIGGWIWGYTKKWWNEMLLNKWTIAYASFCGTLFYLPMSLLNSWFGFPPLLNIMIHGVFHLNNLAWVISNRKHAPSDNDNNQGPKVTLST